MKPVSRKRTSNVGPSRFDPTIPRNQEKTKEGNKTHITAHKNFCVLLEKTSTHEPSSDTTVGERRMGNKNSSGDHINHSITSTVARLLPVICLTFEMLAFLS